MQKPHSMFLCSVVPKNLLSCILCCTEIFTLTFNLNLWKLTHTSAILNNNFSTSLESIMLGHENDEKIWILLLVVQCCTGRLDMMSHVVSPTDMLQSIVTHPAVQLAPDSSSYILLLSGKICSSFAKSNLITFSILKSLSVAASVKELKCFRIIQ